LFILEQLLTVWKNKGDFTCHAVNMLGYMNITFQLRGTTAEGSKII